jgi:hypothetical protein
MKSCGSYAVPRGVSNRIPASKAVSNDHNAFGYNGSRLKLLEKFFYYRVNFCVIVTLSPFGQVESIDFV